MVLADEMGLGKTI